MDHSIEIHQSKTQSDQLTLTKDVLRQSFWKVRSFASDVESWPLELGPPVHSQHVETYWKMLL